MEANPYGFEAAAGALSERFQVMLHVDQDPLAPDGALAGTPDDGTLCGSLLWRSDFQVDNLQR